MANFSKYFNLSEFINSVTASKNHISNIPNDEEIKNLSTLSQHLDAIRTLYNKPIIINSGFRCKTLNLAVGGALRSYHLLGKAADIRPAHGTDFNDSLVELKKVILAYASLPNANLKNGKKSHPQYEIIFYPSFVHFAFKY